MKIEFPQYRKYSNELSYFKILDDNTFIEYKRLGSKLEYYEFNAKILPDRNFISDMLYDYNLHWEKIEEEDFNLFISKFQN